jgi:hypothetical protein
MWGLGHRHEKRLQNLYLAFSFLLQLIILISMLSPFFFSFYGYHEFNGKSVTLKYKITKNSFFLMTVIK